ncbi:MAG: WD40 repeat domain-containing protein, partial [Anaerolineales bacterium]|nr:WD40 repeat domain-containing protein [Anaerolineales bacterium]
GTILVWSVAEQRIERVLGGHDGGVKLVAWSPDGALIASNGSSDELVRVWQADSGRMVQSFAGHSNTVTAVTWSPDGTVVASSSFDSTLKLWDVTTGAEVRSFSVNALGQVLFVSRSPNGEEMVATGNTGLVQLRPPDNTRLTVTLSEHGNTPVNATAWSSDSLRFATGDNGGQILLWSFPVRDNDDPALSWNTQVAVRGLAFAPDDAILAAVVGGNGRFYDPTNGTEVGTPITLHPRSLNVAWSADGLMVAGVGGDGLVRIWQVLERP